jgi:ketosteroid isomerase-like protein
MSEHLDLFNRALKAYSERDVEPFLASFHPDAEWYPVTARVEGDEAYVGHEGIRQWWANVDDTFEEVEGVVDDVRDLGDILVAFGHIRARFKSGVTLDTDIGWVVRFRDGLIVWGRAYEGYAEALEAAGAAG